MLSVNKISQHPASIFICVSRNWNIKEKLNSTAGPIIRKHNDKLIELLNTERVTEALKAKRDPKMLKGISRTLCSLTFYDFSHKDFTAFSDLPLQIEACRLKYSQTS